MSDHALCSTGDGEYVLAKGLCSRHYARLRRTGDIGTAERLAGPNKRVNGGLCSQGDGKPAARRGLCEAHYLRQHRHGRLDLSRDPYTTGLPKGDLPDAHSRHEWVIWAAGFFDGEGSIHARITHTVRVSQTYLVQIAVPQIKREPLVVLQALWGGGITTREPRGLSKRTLYIWRVATRLAREALIEMAPYLVVKSKQAQLAIELQDRMINNRQRITDEERLIRLHMASEITRLNHE